MSLVKSTLTSPQSYKVFFPVQEREASCEDVISKNVWASSLLCSEGRWSPSALVVGADPDKTLIGIGGTGGF